MLLTSPPFAVIDIGSNSVRMVVYHALTRVPMPLFNEKYYCGLARDMSQTDRLHPDGIEEAKKAIARFVLMLERFNVTHSVAIATAAIRDAQDGPAFVQMLKDEFALAVEVIAGEREAELAAKGIIASTWKPEGLCADLGGGSLEIASINDGVITNKQTLPLGTLRLSGADPAACHTIIGEALNSCSFIDQSYPCVYAIGGSFRAIAKMHIRQSEYPLKLVHEYHLSQRMIRRISDEFSEMSEEHIAMLPGIPSKRATTMPLAAMIMGHILERTDSDQVIFSVGGIREGLLYDKLSSQEQDKDPLIASAEDLANLAGRRGKYAHELYDWMTPLFVNESPQRARLRQALCLLSELAWTIDPNFRAEWAYLRILQSDMKGLTHRERITLSTALYHRYQNKWKKDYPETELVDEYDRLWAHCVGMAANLAFQLSGGQAGNLHLAQLSLHDGDIALLLAPEAYPLRTEIVEKRLEGLGSTFKALSNFVI